MRAASVVEAPDFWAARKVCLRSTRHWSWLGNVFSYPGGVEFVESESWSSLGLVAGDGTRQCRVAGLSGAWDWQGWDSMGVASREGYGQKESAGVTYRGQSPAHSGLRIELMYGLVNWGMRLTGILKGTVLGFRPSPE